MITTKCNLCGAKIEAETPESLVAARRLHNKLFHLEKESPVQLVAQGVCPECGATLFAQEGCLMCQSCGFSKCS